MYNISLYKTPIHELSGVAQLLGLERLLIKRDDLLDLYGTKTRHAHRIFSHLRQQGVRSVELVGDGDSNCLRIYAMAACRVGVQPRFRFLTPLRTGNAQIMMKFRTFDGPPDFVLHWYEMKNFAVDACVEAFSEVVGQIDEPIERIYLSSYDATGIGMVVGVAKAKMDTKIITAYAPPPVGGIVIDDSDNDIASMLDEACKRHGVVVSQPPDRRLVVDSCEAVVEEILNVSGVLLDPKYTGRAMYVLMQDAQEGKIRSDERVLFWHTGGIFLNV